MQRVRVGYLACALGALGLAWTAAAFAGASRVCPAYPWSVSREVALFAGASTTVQAALSPDAAPVIETDRLYEVALSPESSVHFALPPGKVMLTGGDSAGILRLRVPAAGLYRVSLEKPFWIDVVVHGRLAQTKAFHGSPDCPGPHKMVEFALPRGTLLLQLSGYVADGVRLTITPAPVAQGHRSGRE